MAKTSDITSRSLISLLPNDWVRWATDIEDASDCEVLNTEFQLVSRNTDALVLVNKSSVGKFLTLFEIQTRYTLEMPERMTAYAALARTRYKLPVVPILVNILPYGKEIPTKYESEFLGIRALQDFRVINLWEFEAEEILRKKLSALIPFIPAMKGGKDAKLLQKAQIQLELDEDLQNTNKLGDLKVALQIFAKIMLGEKAGEILRWTMIDLIKESPFYIEIQKDEAERFVSMLLTQKFGELDDEIKTLINSLSREQTEELGLAIFGFNNLDDVKRWLARTELSLKE